MRCTSRSLYPTIILKRTQNRDWGSPPRSGDRLEAGIAAVLSMAVLAAKSSDLKRFDGYAILQPS
jgi:hypothetical protein